MITAGQIQSWVVGKLKLSRRADQYVPGDFYRSLQDALAYLSTLFPVLNESQTFTTTAGNGVYNLTTSYRPIRIHNITFPSSWTALPIYIENQQMIEVRKSIDNGSNLQSFSPLFSILQPMPFIFSTNQPTYWSYYQDDSQSYIELQDDSTIAADETIVVTYGYVFPDEITDMTQQIPVGEEYKKFICLYIARDLAGTYLQVIPALANMYPIIDREFKEEELHLMSFRQRKQITDVPRRELVLW